MGDSYSKETEEIMIPVIFNIAETQGVTPDISIDGSLLMYSGLKSTAALEAYSSHMVNNLVSNAPDYVNKLGTSLSAFKHVPNAVGLGALVISLLLDVLVKSLITLPKDNPLNMIHRVFAEEKASGVRDSMDEYLNRLRKYAWEPEQVLHETKLWERKLSEQLTRLSNSMLKDNQMSSRSMKIWVNGAAFHAQVLIHEARLLMAGYGSKEEKNLDIRVVSVHSMVDHYQKVLEDLLKGYKSYKRTNVHFDTGSGYCRGYHLGCIESGCHVYDKEIGKKTRDIERKYCYGSSDAYINYMFSNWGQIKKLNEYFTVLKTDIRELITQNRAFTMENV